jgi:hypothetical protein
MRTLNLSPIGEEQIRSQVELKKKIIGTPFFNLNPTSQTDMDILCEHIRFLGKHGIDMNFLGGLGFRIFDYDKIVRKQKKLLNQLDLNNLRLTSVSEHLLKTKFIFIDPSTRLYRDRFYHMIKDYMKLNIPDYLKQHFQKLLSLPYMTENLDIAHIKFWRDMSKIDDDNKTDKTAHFIKWHYDQVKGKSDIFLPPVPYITLNGCDFLVKKTLEINLDAWDLIDDDVATFFNMDAEVFRNKEAVESIINYIVNNPNKSKFVIFNIHNANKILSPSYGLSSMENFGLFLKAIKNIRERADRIFGLLNSGGLGYCLLGCGFDFFGDTVNNYSDFPNPKKGNTGKHRKYLNSFTLYPESFEDVMNYWKYHGTLPCSCPTCRNYNSYSRFDETTVDKKKWSVDCRKHGMNVWNEVVMERLKGISNGDDKLFFERVQRTIAFTKLAPYIKDI